MMKFLCSVAGLGLMLTATPAFCGNDEVDWPRFRGASGDGTSPETGLLDQWPEDGPKQVWDVAIGEGFSGITIARGRLYTMFQEGEGEAKREYAAAYDPDTGKEIWRYEIGAHFDNEFGNGPRSSPTVDGDRVYVFGSNGNLIALTVEGEKLWSVDFREKYESKLPRWGFSTSPLVEGDTLIMEVGGGEGELFGGFDKMTGEQLWLLESGEPSYNTPTRVVLDDEVQLVGIKGFQKVDVISFNANGELLWSFPYAEQTMAIVQPLYVAPDRFMLSATGNGGAMMIRVKKGTDGYEVEELWRNARYRNHFSGSVVHGGHIYGFDNALVKCVDAETGEQKWVRRGFGKGSLIMAEDHLYLLGDRGKLALVEADPEEYREVSSFQAFQGKCWTAPTLVGGRLYMRDHERMKSYELRKEVPVQ